MTKTSAPQPRVLLDVSVLGRALHIARARTGVARVVHCLAEALMLRLGDSLRLCASQSLRELITLRQYLAANALGPQAPALLADQGSTGRLAAALAPWYPRPGGGKVLRRAAELAVHSLGCPLPQPGGPALVGCDLFHATYYPFPASTAQLAGLRRCMTLYDLIPILHPEYFRGARDHLVHRMLRSIGPEDWVFAISHSTRDDLCNHGRIAPERILVTHLAAAETFSPRTDVDGLAAVRARLGIPEGGYVLAVGTLEPRKNLERVVRAFFALVEQQGIRDLSLVLVGPKGWDFAGLFQTIAAAPRLAHRVITTGFVDDDTLACLYSGALMFVYPSLYEGFGLPPLEAMQCGAPVVTSNRSSLPEIAGNAATLVDPTDEEAIASAMHALHGDAALREAHRNAGLRQAARFSWQRTAEQTVAGYRLALDAA